jgi:shikimate dehydrogenase
MAKNSQDLYAVIGHPVAHSRSPEIHAAFAAATGQSIGYERLLAPLDDFAGTVRRLAASGGRGCNVTVPFKFEALALCPHQTARARLAGAANTLRFDPEGWLADNTDGVGLVRDLESNAGQPLAGQRLLLLGAGGAAAGVLGPLIATGPSRLVVANRTPEKAHALVDSHRGWASAHRVPLEAAGLDAAGEDFDVLINASASSLHGAAPVLADRVLRAGALVVDLMYGPSTQAFLGWAAARGARTRDGLGMLVEQAAAAFELWRGVRPDTAPVLLGLRRQLEQAAAG